MARTPGASCLMDLRNAAVLRDYVISTNKCAPGPLRPIGAMDNCQPPACGYDRPKDMLAILGAVLIVGTAIGIVHTIVVFLPSMVIEYDAGFLEICLIAAMTYLVMLLTTCLCYPVIEYAGHKLTALFGMILIFIGILIDSQVFHIAVLYVSHLMFIGVGAGLAYAASMTLPADLFRTKLSTAQMLIDISGSLGTIFYMWLCAYVLNVVGYKWTKLLQAILVLLFTLAIHVYPKTRLMYASNCDPPKGTGADGVRDCIYKNSIAEAQERKQATPQMQNCEETEGQTRNLLCVCVCDLRLFGDRSFLLWACLVMVATMNFHLPYLTINSYAETKDARVTYWYVTAFCLGSIAARCAFVGNVDFTFPYNRTVFQGSIFVSGVLWIVINWAVTFGWILVICVLLGAIEGILCVVTARVALSTIPQRWYAGAWVSCILCHAIGMFIVTIFTAVIALRTFSYTLTYITTGIIQIIVSLLATLLPSEEDNFTDHSDHSHVVAIPKHPYFDSQSYQYQYKQGVGGTSSGVGAYSTAGLTGGGRLPSSSSYDYSKFSTGFCGSGSSGAGYRFADYSGTGMMSSRRSPGFSGGRRTDHYKCNCAICQQYGCIPECLPDCTPGGSIKCDEGGK